MSLISIYTEVLVSIKEKLYATPIHPHEKLFKYKTLISFVSLHNDHEYYINECHALKKKIERLIAKGYLSETLHVIR
jgi:hypothetical protein